MTQCQQCWWPSVSSCFQRNAPRSSVAVVTKTPARVGPSLLALSSNVSLVVVSLLFLVVMGTVWWLHGVGVVFVDGSDNLVYGYGGNYIFVLVVGGGGDLCACVCVCVCACVCVRACVRVCVCVWRWLWFYWV